MINMFHVYKSYDASVSALTDITLKIDKGEFVFITGASGAGKQLSCDSCSALKGPRRGRL